MKKTVLITGVTSGFGDAMAKRFVKEGWKVVGTGRRADRLAALGERLGEDFVPLCFDITDESAMDGALKAVLSGSGAIDVLINNAGLALGTKPVPQARLSDWKTMIDTNVTGLVTLTHKLMPTLIERRGLVINIASVAAHWPYPGGNVYGATKAFLYQFSLGLRSDLHGTGVRVTAIEPGMCESEFTLVRTGGDQDAYDRLYKGANALQPDDIADMAFWIASQPPHVNINSIEVMPVSQSWAGLQVHKSDQ